MSRSVSTVAASQAVYATQLSAASAVQKLAAMSGKLEHLQAVITGLNASTLRSQQAVKAARQATAAAGRQHALLAVCHRRLQCLVSLQEQYNVHLQQQLASLGLTAEHQACKGNPDLSAGLHRLEERLIEAALDSKPCCLSDCILSSFPNPLGKQVSSSSAESLLAALQGNVWNA
jgi:hypothetical protein